MEKESGVIYRYIKAYCDFINYKNTDIKSAIINERININKLIEKNNFKVDNYV